MFNNQRQICGIGFSIFGLLFGPLGFYLLFHGLTVKMDAVRRREAARSDIKYLEAYNNIVAYTKDDKAITISLDFGDGKTAAQALKAICDWTGYPTKRKANS